MEQIKQLYRFGKKLPMVGPVLVAMRESYQSSVVYKHKLRKRDIRRAEEISRQLFGEPGLEYVHELTKSSLFKQVWSYGHSGDFDILMLYAITRATIPQVVVETGVASGRSSAAILSALKKNGSGKLYSIDLPQHFTDAPTTYVTHEGNNELTGFVPEGKQPGWLVPDELRDQWELILGDAKEELTKLLAAVSAVDVFYHDSDHSEEHMTFEFETIFPKLSPNGFVLSDDVNWNDAWKKFISRHRLNEVCIYRNMGIAQIE